jgi:hypothetical protein
MSHTRKQLVLVKKSHSDLPELYEGLNEWVVRKTAGIGLGKIVKSFKTKKEALNFIRK